MKNIYKQLSIKQKLLMLFSIQIIIPMFFMGMMLYRTSNDIIQNKSIDYSGDILKMIELRFNDFSNNVEMAAKDLLYDQVIYQLLEEEPVKNVINKEQIDDFNNILRKVCLSREEIQAIAVVDNRKKFYTYDASSGRASIFDSLDYETIHQRALDGKGELVWYVEQDDDGKLNHIFALRSIQNINRYEEIGLLIIMIKTEELESVYGNLSTEFMDRIAIVTQQGEFIVGTGVPSQERMARLNEMDETTLATSWIDTTDHVLVSYRDVIHPPWRIITEISLDKLNMDMNRFRNNFLTISIATLLILSLLSLFMALDIIDPIKRLVDAMTHMKQEKVHDVIVVDRKDELGYLSLCFNDMSEEIDFLLNQVYKEQLTRKEAELKTLQAQINPHFLFNTLESINWMARLNEGPQISEMVTALSSLLEAGIGKGVPMVAMKDELNFVDSYILIMKNRYGDRLTFEKNIDRDFMDVKVPKLMLQPILENAIYHGIDKVRSKGTIRLNLFKVEQSIQIEVIDNGPGMSEEKLTILNHKLEQMDDGYLVSTESNNNEGIGLPNVNRRLKLFYGEKYGISVQSQASAFTKVIITIPIESAGKGDVDRV